MNFKVQHLGADRGYPSFQDRQSEAIDTKDLIVFFPQQQKDKEG